MATSTLRPLGVGEILDASVKMVTRHWRALVLPLLALTLPLSIVISLFATSIDAASYDQLFSDTTTTTESDGSVLASALILLALGMVAFLIVFTACFKAVSDAWLGGAPRMGPSLRYGLPRLGWVLLLGVIWFVGNLVGWSFFLLPGVWLSVIWSLSLPALLAERIGPFAALSRSFKLLQGRFWATLLLLLVSSVMVYIVSLLVQVPLAAVAELAAEGNDVVLTIAGAISYTISFAVTLPFLAAVLTILYYDQRVRKEGLDVQLLADGLPEVPPPPLSFEKPPAASAPLWTPPQEEERTWSSPSGWSAPAPPEPEPERERAHDAPPSYPTRSSDDAPPRHTLRKEPPVEEESSEGWLPPEAPRGPGGT